MWLQRRAGEANYELVEKHLVPLNSVGTFNILKKIKK